jgi:hypothetical protein
MADEKTGAVHATDREQDRGIISGGGWCFLFQAHSEDLAGRESLVQLDCSQASGDCHDGGDGDGAGQQRPDGGRLRGGARAAVAARGPAKPVQVRWVLLDGRVRLAAQMVVSRADLELLLLLLWMDASRVVLPGSAHGARGARRRPRGVGAARDHLHPLGHADGLERALDQYLALVLAARAFVYPQPNLALSRAGQIHVHAHHRKGHFLMDGREPEELGFRLLLFVVVVVGGVRGRKGLLVRQYSCVVSVLRPGRRGTCFGRRKASLARRSPPGRP